MEEVNHGFLKHELDVQKLPFAKILPNCRATLRKVGQVVLNQVVQPVIDLNRDVEMKFEQIVWNYRNQHRLQPFLYSTCSGVMPFPSCNGVFRWKINLFYFTNQMISFPFFTSNTGYKLCLGAHLNRGMGMNMSLLLFIMEGENDGMLPWPLKCSIDFKLVNIRSNNNISLSVSGKDLQRSSSGMDVAFECPTFVSLGQIENDGFIKENWILLECVVKVMK